MDRREDVQTSAREILLGTRARRVVPFPGMNGQTVMLRPLADDELEECAAAAEGQLRDELEADELAADEVLRAYPEMLESAAERAVLRIALVTSADDPRPAFTDDELRLFDAGTLRALFVAFARLQGVISPGLSLGTRGADESTRVRAELGKRLGMFDRLRALHALNLVSFYGARSARELTDWQVWYFAKALEEHSG